MPQGYYSDLSGASSDDETSSSEPEVDDECDAYKAEAPLKKRRLSTSSHAPSERQLPKSPPLKQQKLWNISPSGPGRSKQKTSNKNYRFILHADVDSFYCQCEMIDRKIPADRPFAIGQKHIIVTCNYAARSYGVQKLETRERALAKLPSLLILEGSDLERYRKHARRIYESFRATCKDISNEILVSKGSMDEMMADLSVLFQDAIKATANGPAASVESSCFVYGETSSSEANPITIVEDQTGESVSVKTTATNLAEANELLRKNLHAIAETHAMTIRQKILHETGFTTTFGLSTNPLLAKIASGLRKPGTVNILYPWRAKSLIKQMPLRKLTGLGHRTMKLLKPALEQSFPGRCFLKSGGNQDSVTWTCRDLIETPSVLILECLRSLPGNEESRTRMVARFKDLCQGIDNSQVVDDNGGLPKIVSCENSFRRGTVRTKEAVNSALADLYDRLPRLVQHRIECSANQSLAYPTTLSVVARLVVDKSHPAIISRRSSRPFITKRKQCRFDGKTYVTLSKAESRANFIRRHVEPLVHSLVFASVAFDVTRISVAVLNFQDMS